MALSSSLEGKSLGVCQKGPRGVLKGWQRGRDIPRVEGEKKKHQQYAPLAPACGIGKSSQGQMWCHLPSRVWGLGQKPEAALLLLQDRKSLLCRLGGTTCYIEYFHPSATVDLSKVIKGACLAIFSRKRNNGIGCKSHMEFSGTLSSYRDWEMGLLEGSLLGDVVL